VAFATVSIRREPRFRRGNIKGVRAGKWVALGAVQAQWGDGNTRLRGNTRSVEGCWRTRF